MNILHDVGTSLSPLIDLGQIEGGFVQGMGWLTREELVWDSEYKLPSVGDVPEAFVVQLLPRAEEPGVIYGSKAVGEPPLMLAISVREALRDAVAAFGRGGIVPLGAPATPEAVFWAIELEQLTDLARRGEDCVGHAPREVGSKMVLTVRETWGSIGGGNLEKTAVERGRAMLEGRTFTPELLTVPLVPGPPDVQVCGGEVTVLLEPLRTRRPCVAIFGIGHVGLALAQILRMLPIELWIVDARPEMLSEARIGWPGPGPARPVVRTVADPAGVVDELPPGAHVVVVTHDPELDVAILQRALRREEFGFVGCIGSSVKRVHNPVAPPPGRPHRLPAGPARDAYRTPGSSRQEPGRHRHRHCGPAPALPGGAGRVTVDEPAREVDLVHRVLAPEGEEDGEGGLWRGCVPDRHVQSAPFRRPEDDEVGELARPEVTHLLGQAEGLCSGARRQVQQVRLSEPPPLGVHLLDLVGRKTLLQETRSGPAPHVRSQGHADASVQVPAEREEPAPDEEVARGAVGAGRSSSVGWDGAHEIKRFVDLRVVLPVREEGADRGDLLRRLVEVGVEEDVRKAAEQPLADREQFFGRAEGKAGHHRVPQSSTTVPPLDEVDGHPLGLLWRLVEFGLEVPVGEDEAACDPQARPFCLLEQRLLGGGEVGTEDEGRDRPVPEEAVDERPCHFSRVLNIRKPYLLRQGHPLQPVQQPRAQAARDPDLWVVDVEVHEPRGEVTRPQVRNGRLGEGAAHGVIGTAGGDALALDGHGTVLEDLEGIRVPERILGRVEDPRAQQSDHAGILRHRGRRQG